MTDDMMKDKPDIIRAAVEKDEKEEVEAAEKLMELFDKPKPEHSLDPVEPHRSNCRIRRGRECNCDGIDACRTCGMAASCFDMGVPGYDKCEGAKIGGRK